MPVEIPSESSSSGETRQTPPVASPMIAADLNSTGEKTWRLASGKNAPLDLSAAFGTASATGGIYRWGMAVVHGGPCDSVTEVLSRLACQGKLKKKHREVDLVAAARSAVEQFDDTMVPSPADASRAVLWAAALPRLHEILPPDMNSKLIQSLVQLWQAIVARDRHECPAHLILAGELGLTLALRLAKSAELKSIKKTSTDAVLKWCRGGMESVDAAMETPASARIILASLLRCRTLIGLVGKRKLGKAFDEAGYELATAVATMTNHGGTSAFSSAKANDVKDDACDNGLLDQAKAFDSDALAPAINAAMGASQTGGRIAWEVSLPEPWWLSDTSKVAVLLPEWDVRRGRTHIEYRCDDIQLEVFAGRSRVLAGHVQTRLDIESAPQHPRSGWEEICRYTDDDVHYLELEQKWTAGLVLQRQFLLIREDRCLLFADAVLPDADTQSPDLSAQLEYQCRLPLDSDTRAIEDDETQEIFLAQKKNEALVMPLSGAEWKVGPSSARLEVSSDQHLTLTAKDKGRLYAPIWFDFARRRFQRKRTWRQLTVGDSLRLCPTQEASAFRVQMGSEQWCLYRSLGDRRCRTFLGKHMMADFFVSRFDSGDGSHEALITVDDQED